MQEHIEFTIKNTQQWFLEAVLKYQFCPYAKQPHIDNSIRYCVFTDDNILALLEHLALCCIELDACSNKPHYLETTLLIIAPENHTYLSYFDDYLDALDVANDFLESPTRFTPHFSKHFTSENAHHILSNWNETYQLAGFHPDYQFEHSAYDDASNYTNRSPYPLFHIIRNKTIEKARLNDKLAHQIVKNNLRTIENLSENDLQALQELRSLRSE